MPAPIPSFARIRCFLLIICILIGFMLLGLTRRAFACPYLGSSYTDSDATWSVDNYCDSTLEAAHARRDGLASQFYRNDGPFLCPNAGAICGSAPVGTSFYLSYVTPVGSYHLAVFWVNSDSCSAQRAEAESSCGGPDSYIIDDATCLWLCKNPNECTDKAKQECVDEENIEWIDKENCKYKCKSKCTDRDKDGVEDVCDYCPNDPEVSDQIKVIYRYNGGVDQCATGYMTCDGRLIRNFPPGTVFDNPDTICVPDESVVVPCNMTEDCEKDTDGDGQSDGEDDDDDGDGIPDSEDEDRDGDKIPNNREDTDGDGERDPSDTDDDGDGKEDRHDPDHDTDGDGKDNEHDDDDDGDGTPDSKDPDQTDCDLDGTYDSEDSDDDGDTIPDVVDTERVCKKDADGDGVPDPGDGGGGGGGTPGGGGDVDTDGDGIPDIEDPDDDGDGTPDTDDPPDDGGGTGTPGSADTKPYQTKEEPYAFITEIGQQFGDRFTQFITEMKTTSIFSIPGQIFGDVPSGGSAVMTYDGGEHFGGQQQIDFSNWSSGLAAIRAALYAVFAAVAIRIGTLGR